MPSPFQRYATIIRNGQSARRFEDTQEIWPIIAASILGLSADHDAFGKVLQTLPSFVKGQTGVSETETINVRTLVSRLQLQNASDIQYIAAAGNTIYAAMGDWVRVKNTTAGAITLTSAPTIPDGENGQQVDILNIGTQSITLQDQGTLANSNLRLGTATRTLGPRQSIRLRYSTDIGDWVEEDFSDWSFACSCGVSAALLDFPPQSPGGSLTSGVGATVTLSPVPLGVNGADTNHYLYITGGTGTAEAVLITGGTAVSGAASGTVTFTPANNHSGAWTIKSATGGMQEAINYVAAQGGGTVEIPTGNTRVYARITITGSAAIQISGCGADWANSRLVRDSAYFNGDILYAESTNSSSAVHLNNFAIINADGTFENTGGFAIHFKNGFYTYPLVSDIWVEAGYGGMWLESSQCKATKFTFFQPNYYHHTSVSGISITGPSLGNFTDCAMMSNLGTDGVGADGGFRLSYGVLITGCDGLQFDNCFISSKYGIYLQPNGVNQLDDISMSNCIVDGVTIQGFVSVGNNNPHVFCNIRFSACHFNGVPTSPIGQDLIDIGGDIDYVQFIGCNVNLATGSGFVVKGGNNYLGTQKASIIIADNDISENNGANVGNQHGISILADGSGISIVGNRIQNRSASGHQQHGISSATTLDNCVIKDNNLSNNTLGPLNLGGTVTNSVIEGNVGIDDQIGSVASAATIALPDNPIFLVTGVTGVGAVTSSLPPRRLTFRTPGGAVTFTAGASIGNTFTTTLNVPVNAYWDGTQLWGRP